MQPTPFEAEHVPESTGRQERADIDGIVLG